MAAMAVMARNIRFVSPIAMPRPCVPIGCLTRSAYYILAWLLGDCRSVCKYCIVVVAFGHLHSEARDLRGLYVCTGLGS